MGSLLKKVQDSGIVDILDVSNSKEGFFRLKCFQGTEVVCFYPNERVGVFLGNADALLLP